MASTCQLVLETIRTIALTLGAGIAIWGAATWRKDISAKRKFELADTTLTHFYEARRIFQWARSPMALSSEGETREKEQYESEGETRTKNSYFIPAERLFKENNFFSELDTLKIQCKIHFGQESQPPFDVLIEVYGDILLASKMLIDTFSDRDRTKKENILKWETTIGRWGITEDDEIHEKIEATINDIEKLLTPFLK